LNKKIQRRNLYVIFLTLFIVIFFASCEKKDDSVLDPSYKSPLLSNPFKSKDTVFTVSSAPVLNLVSSVSVNPNEGGNIKSVTCKVYSPDGSMLATYAMQDDGNAPDSVAGDFRYSCAINVTNISCLLVGQYSIQLIAENNAGLLSNQINSTFTVVNTANLPPLISEPNLPDSVVRPISGSFDLTITIKVIDPDGSCDINTVYFDAYRPSGNYIGRIPMTYTGNDTYSFTNPVLPSNVDSAYGYFKYYFQANDKSNALSLFLKDSIKFVRP
jgi:hypothetical protein